MTRPTLATVLSGRPWEARLVEMARKTGRIRIVGRAYEPQDIGRYGSVDAIALGSETSWISPEIIALWKRRGHRVIGLHPKHDQPGAALLRSSNADLVVPEDCDTLDLINQISVLGFDPKPTSTDTRVTVVTGTRGAPGRSTVAMALGATLPNSVVIDADQVPGLVPMFKLSHATQSDNEMVVSLSQKRSVRVRAFPSWTGSWGKAVSTTLLMSSREQFANVIVDDGLLDSRSTMLRTADTVVLVVDGSILGITRAAAALEKWTLPQPKIVLNKVQDPSAVRTCRYLLGVEPSITLGWVPSRDPLKVLDHLSPLLGDATWLGDSL